MWDSGEIIKLNICMTIVCNVTMQLGAFLAGALLAETNFRTQIEADIRPFRGLLIGLFFLTTGTSIDMQVNDYCVYMRTRLLNFLSKHYFLVKLYTPQRNIRH